MLTPKVMQWEEQARLVLSEIRIDETIDVESALEACGVSEDDFITYELGIIGQESKGNQFILGDWKKGFKPVVTTTYEDALAHIDEANSVGLGQLNYGAGTPQGMGFIGAKSELLDSFTNLYYSERYLLYNMKRYNNIQKALSAYNAGHSSGVNIASYVEPILNSIKDILAAANDALDNTFGEKKT